MHRLWTIIDKVRRYFIIKDISVENIVLWIRKRLYGNANKVLSVSAAALLITAIVILSPIYSYINSMSYDTYMRFIKKPVKQDNTLLLIDIDDNSLNSDFIGYSWQWPRYLHGDALEVLTDFGAKAVIYDIEFLNNSPPGVNMTEVNGTLDMIAEKFNVIGTDFISVAQSIANINAVRSDLSPTIKGFNDKLSDHYSALKVNFDKMVINNDLYFSKRIHYSGKTYGTVNMLYDDTIEGNVKPDKETGILLKKFGYPADQLLKNRKNHPAVFNQNISDFPQSDIVNQFRGVGFTAVKRDLDASTRSIALFMERDGYIIPQLSLKPFLDIYNITPQNIDLSSRSRVVLKNVNINNETIDIKIPLDERGLMRINWPSGTFDKIFTHKTNLAKGQHLSYLYLLDYKINILGRFEKNISNLANFNDETSSGLYNEYIRFKQYKEQIVENETLSDGLRAGINNFLDDFVERIIKHTDKTQLKKIEDEINLAAANEKEPENRNALLNIYEEVKSIYTEINRSAEQLKQRRLDLKNDIENKICFIGLTSTGTTDIGSNPFDKDFENVGTHPSIYNTLMTQSFIGIVPTYINLIITIVFFLIITIALIKKEALFTSIAGALSVIFIVFVLTIFYWMTNIYVSPVIPVFYGMVSFLTMVLIKFVLIESEKRLIKSTFNRYLSPAVISELLKDKKKIELGGERRNCTAMFTDIESFSSFSEKFMDDPKGLVSLLNGYLSAMSDIILDHGGTIDKYEGDAIIAFFGAPKDMSDHPFKASLASLRIKQIESNLNEDFITKGLIDKPLYTRIGLNTGDMFVGNMGTFKRLEYTMIGHSVNLASRLEGVNKQYKTYQLVSEYTNSRINDKILTRSLDSVRVVNINTPIRLFELIGLLSEVSPEIKEAVADFHRGLELFEKRDFSQALSIFENLITGSAFDNTTDVYTERCRKFIQTPPPANWDGVYNLTLK